ncbi:hypothetical protein [Luteolibacter rhizosphaerae]|nr:hypothetical protein [Luteolibacter rhizosphaerae]
MRVESFSAEYLEEVLSWWSARGEGEMPAWLLPPCGVVAVDDDGPCAAGWLTVFEGVAAGQIDWLIGRPGLAPRQARAACKAVYEGLERAAREKGLRMIFASALRTPMAREARACGFRTTAEGVTHLAKAI